MIHTKNPLEKFIYGILIVIQITKIFGNPQNRIWIEKDENRKEKTFFNQTKSQEDKKQRWVFFEEISFNNIESIRGHLGGKAPVFIRLIHMSIL